MKQKQNKNKQNKPNKNRKQKQNKNPQKFPTQQTKGFSSGSNSKVVSNEELIGTIDSSTGFVATSFSVNPGQYPTFPWLSKEAQQWEKYAFEYLEFIYEPMVSPYSNIGTAGKIVISFDSDASDASPINLTQAENVKPSNSGMPYMKLNLDIPKEILKGMTNAFYVRTGMIPASSDIKTYDLGTVTYSTFGQTAVGRMGQIKVRYRVRFMIPVLENTVTAPKNFNCWCARETKLDVTGETVAGYSVPTAIYTNGIGALADENGFITLPPGNYLISCNNLVVSNGTIPLSGIVENTVGITKALGGGGTTNIISNTNKFANQYFPIENTTCVTSKFVTIDAGDTIAFYRKVDLVSLTDGSFFYDYTIQAI